MFYFSDSAFFIVQTLILVLFRSLVCNVCSTRLASCNFSENELIARVFTSLKLPGIQYKSTFYIA